MTFRLLPRVLRYGAGGFVKLLPFKWSKSRANEDEDGDRGGGVVWH